MDKDPMYNDFFHFLNLSENFVGKEGTKYFLSGKANVSQTVNIF